MTLVGAYVPLDNKCYVILEAVDYRVLPEIIAYGMYNLNKQKKTGGRSECLSTLIEHIGTVSFVK